MRQDVRSSKLLLDHLGSNTTAKHSIKLPQTGRLSVQLAPYKTNSKTCNFEKAGIENMLAGSIIEPRQNG